MSLQPSLPLPSSPRKLVPFPAPTLGATLDLDISAKVQGPGGWVDLEDGEYYQLHSDSFAEAATSWRKQDITADWIEGSYTKSAVRDNTQEAVSVWVRGSTHYEFAQKMQDLADAFSQTSYLFMKRIEDMVEYWTCPSPADYSKQTQREFLHAKIGVFKATVYRLPTVSVYPASSDEL